MNSIRNSRTGVRVLAFLLASGLASHASAETMGKPSPFDRRVQTATYNADEVYRVQVKVGRQSLIKLPEDETVIDEEGLIISGDPSAWEMGVNKIGNKIGIKPLTDQDPDTNLTINTDKNTYLVDLKLVKKLEDTTYLLRFVMPEPPKVLAAVNAPVNPCSGRENRAWQTRGDKDLAPSEVWDNGTFTCFRFATNKPRPVLYQVMPDGTETVVPTDNQQNVMVAHRVSSLFHLRLNSQVLALRTQLQPTPYNFKGTTTGEVRTLKQPQTTKRTAP